MAHQPSMTTEGRVSDEEKTDSATFLNWCACPRPGSEHGSGSEPSLGSRELGVITLEHVGCTSDDNGNQVAVVDVYSSGWAEAGYPNAVVSFPDPTAEPGDSV